MVQWVVNGKREHKGEGATAREWELEGEMAEVIGKGKKEGVSFLGLCRVSYYVRFEQRIERRDRAIWRNEEGGLQWKK
ncbi:hypothetical protein L6452_08984 [Arctium lappa]|uniref:Uncharacterized protein n=1 Tax=Arctium lappa TaxID=4217 RepID=A0ACB9DJ39_ARCLA|nr:hypothetical protein L6452_08984 [Arctium lappa]